MLKNVYVAGGVRTPFGSFNGSLSALTAPEGSAEQGGRASASLVTDESIVEIHVVAMRFAPSAAASVSDRDARESRNHHVIC